MDTNFYLGAALAFLLALLGWSDQIRGTQEKTRNQEREFLRTYKTRWQDLRAVIRPSENIAADQQLLSVLRLLNQGGLQEEVDISLLRSFERLDELRTRLERTYTARYWLIFSLTAQMFASGVLLTYFTGPICPTTTLSWEHLASSLAIALIAAIMSLTFVAGIQESSLRWRLNEIEDALRTAEERRRVRGEE